MQTACSHNNITQTQSHSASVSSPGAWHFLFIHGNGSKHRQSRCRFSTHSSNLSHRNALRYFEPFFCILITTFPFPILLPVGTSAIPMKYTPMPSYKVQWFWHHLQAFSSCMITFFVQTWACQVYFLLNLLTCLLINTTNSWIDYLLSMHLRTTKIFAEWAKLNGITFHFCS